MRTVQPETNRLRARRATPATVVGTVAALAAAAVVIAPSASAATAPVWPAAAAVRLYVDPAGTSATCAAPGAGACSSVQRAVTVAKTHSGSNVTVDIAAGTYTENVVVGAVPAGGTLTLQGAGPNVTVIDGNSAGTVIDHEGGALALRGLMLTHGVAGSATGGRGGGLFSTGDALTISDTYIAASDAGPSNGDGGGLWAGDTKVTIDSSTIADSFANRGAGAFVVAATTSITNSTFTGNSGTGGGANLAIGSYTYNGPRGPINDPGVVTVVASTFAHANPIGGPAIGDTSGETVFIDSGYVPVNVTFSGSLFSGSSCDSDATTVGAISDGGHNVQSDTSCHFGSTSTSSSSTTDVAVGLAANGHPAAAPTLAIDSASSARDKVPAASCPAVDERGVARTGTTCDAGAFEYDGTATPPPPSASDGAITSKDGASAKLDLTKLTYTGGAAATYALGDKPAHGKVTLRGTVVTYTPDPAYPYGYDSFTYSVTTAGGTASGRVQVTIVSTPIANPDKASTYGSTKTPGTSILIDVEGNDDPRGYGVGLAVARAPKHGSASLALDGSVLRYVPAKGFFGTDTFTYTLSNTYASATATVTVVVQK